MGVGSDFVLVCTAAHQLMDLESFVLGTEMVQMLTYTDSAPRAVSCCHKLNEIGASSSRTKGKYWNSL